MLSTGSLSTPRRIAAAKAFTRRWLPVALSALPLWESGQSAYRTIALVLLAGGASAILGAGAMAPLAAALAVRLVFQPRALFTWFGAVFPLYVVALWVLSGFNPGLPWEWTGLWSAWFANRPISLWIPVCTALALLAWLGPTRAGAERVDLSFPRFRSAHFAGFAGLCVVLAWLVGCYVGPSGAAVRIVWLLGIVLVMSIASRLFSSVQHALRTDSKRLAVSEVQREDPQIPAAARVASLVQAPVALPPVDLSDPFAMSGSEEMVMPIVPVGIREGGIQDPVEEMSELYPQKGDILAPARHCRPIRGTCSTRLRIPRTTSTVSV